MSTSLPRKVIDPLPSASRSECTGRAPLVLPTFRPMQCLGHILVPVDFSEGSKVAFDYSLRLAKEYHARVTLLHIVNSAPLPLDSGFYDLPPAERLSAAEAGMAAMLSRAGVAAGTTWVETLVMLGEPAESIREQAAKLEVDVMVLNTHGYSGIKQLLFGGITKRVLRRAPCAVLVIRPGDPSFGSPETLAVPRNILVPVDFSPRSEVAIQSAVVFAGSVGGTVSLLHVVEPALLDEEMVAFGANFQEYSADAGARLHALAQRTVPDAVRGDCSVRRGTPFAQIVAEVHLRKVDLVALTTHGRTGFAHLLLGSTAEQVLRHATCPVLTIQEP